MPDGGPLSGIVVLDLTRVLAGPYCTMILSDLGARVIKVERPKIGDDARHVGPFIEGRSAYFMSLNRGKQSIALDLKNEADRVHFEALVAGADVLVENYRPGTMEKLGYSFEVLSKKHPRLIYAATSGFGQTGPYARRPAYDVVVQGMGGIMSLTGEPGGPMTRVGTSIGDLAAGLFTAIGVASALYHRALTGEGQLVDVSMLDCQVALLENAIARYQATQQVPGPIGSRHPSITPFGAFATADGAIIIAAGNDKLFRALCDGIGRPDLPEHVDFASNALRTENVDALKSALEQALVQQPGAHWLDELERLGIPCGPINNVADVMDDPQVKARNMIVTMQDAKAGALSIAGNPIKMSRAHDPPTRGPAPELDADREALLAEIASSRD
jgi:CoA:oxalate CoA-transferase